MARDFKTLSVRIKPETFDDLEKHLDEHEVTQARFIESLISYFAKQDKEQQKLIVRGIGTDYLKFIGDALQLVTWGDHSFFRAQWPRAIRTYDELNRIASMAEENPADAESEDGSAAPQELKGVLSLRRIAWYKLGTAWIKVAQELRHQALVELGSCLFGNISKDSRPREWNELYDAAIDSLKVSFANHSLCNQSLKQDGGQPHPTILYNQACSWSLIAQYITERNSEFDSDDLKLVAKKEWDNYEKKKEEAKAESRKLCLRPSDTKEVENALRKSNESLRKIKEYYKEDTPGMPLGDTLWLFDYALTDEDLACFRNGREDDFDEWQHTRKTRISLLNSYNRFRPNLPAEILKVIKNEFD